MRKTVLVALAVVLGTLATAQGAGARLPAPRLVGPANGATAQEFPTISWNAVRGAAYYEYQVSADPRFHSIAGSGAGKGTSRTRNLAAALDQVVPDGTYSWRARALTATDQAGAWSATRRIVKAWTAAPQITGGDGANVTWPSTPLVLSWSAVPYALKYIVTIATDPALSNVVLGSASQPQYTQSTSFVLPNTLAPGSYYWAVTPVDAEIHRGVRSRVATFNWTWPTSTSTDVSDLNADPRVFDPLFSWHPVAGAARYEVEVNSAQDFPAGSKWCCSAPTIGTSLAPQRVLANNGYYWRVRAIDANGNAGVWNYGPPFTKAFDSVTPSIPSLTVRDASGNALAGVPTTDTPIVTWDPVAGASRYDVQLGPFGVPVGSPPGTQPYCDWSKVAFQPYHAETATTSWTPLGSPATRPGPSAWPNPQHDTTLATGGSYCVRVLARSDDDAKSQQVISDWTYLNGGSQPAFFFAAPPSVAAQPFDTVTPTSAYLLPANASPTTRTPLFTWARLSGARGYYVVVARDSGFTQVVDVGYTNVPAYAPRLANGAPLSDETTSYYWAVIPTGNPDGTSFSDNVLLDSPQSFNKSSTPPALLQPGNGANVSTWPTFRWTPAENVRDYRVQVSQDPSFGNPIDDITTDATAYTSSSTYPADTVLYWRVRGNDTNGQGLNWSQVGTFTRRLPASSPAAGNPTAGDGLPPVSWAAVPGAISYDVHIDQGDGTSTDSTVDSTAFAPTERHGIGTIHWQVRPVFPTTSFSKVTGGFFAPQPFLLSLGPPTGARGVKTGSRLVISWNPDGAAKQYQVDVSTTDGFSTTMDSHRVDGTSWAPDIDFNLTSNRRQFFWRVAAVDSFGTIGSFATGTFGAAPRPRPAAKCTTSSAKSKKKQAKPAPRCRPTKKKKPTPKHR
jgi:hypothetical protein